MTARLVKRRAHPRRLPSGRTTFVRETLVFYDGANNANQNAYRHPCPVCGTEIITVRMPNRGIVHFEGAVGLTKIKHSCLHIDRNRGRKRDDQTLDLFDSTDRSQEVKKAVLR